MQDFIEHLGVYLIVNGFLFVLNMITGPDSLWFYWIAIFWGIGLALQAWDVVSSDGSLARKWASRTATGRNSRESDSPSLVPTLRDELPQRQENVSMSSSEENSHRSRGIDELAREQVGAMDALIKHSGAFLAVGLFFLITNLLTGPGDLWFFWPMLPWMVGLGIHAWVVYWDRRKFYDRWEERAAEQLRQRASAVSTQKTNNASEIQQIMERAADLIDEMRKNARRIPDPQVRSQALEACASSDQVLSAIGDHPEELPIARDFLSRFLEPASTIVGDYSRLANRNVPSARKTLKQVEEHDLPLLKQKANELYDRLHRGTLIDLEVAREMLTLDMPISMDRTLPPETGSGREA